MAFTKPNKKYITIELSDKQHLNLSVMAADAKMKIALYAQFLFEAAYAARVGIQPDKSLDAVVARVAVLHGAGHASKDIAAKLEISPKLVNRIVKAWEDEVLGRAA